VLRNRRFPRYFFAFVAFIAVTLVLGAGTAAADPPAPPGTPTATTFSGRPSVGAVFEDGLTNDHSCSASVVSSPGHNLVLTAAHCVSGTGAGIQFVPGYLNGHRPYGYWTVQRVWVDPRWISSQNPQDDYAFLQVAPRRIDGHIRNVQDLTGGSDLGWAPGDGAKITDIAYPYGINDAPIKCTTHIVYTAGYPTFNCHGYPGGTSGSPFLAFHPGRATAVVGLIGGLHQGGCYEWNSFSSPFGARIHRTYGRAVRGAPADTVPTAGGDGC
jgi:V8-like Glu-specific endopeptidase